MPRLIQWRTIRTGRKGRNSNGTFLFVALFALICAAGRPAPMVGAVSRLTQPGSPVSQFQPEPGSTARLQLDNLTFRYHDIRLQGLSGTIEIGSNGTEQLVTFSDLTVAGIRCPGLSQRLSHLQSPGTMRGSLRWNPETGAIDTRGLRIRLPGLGVFDLSVFRAAESAPIEIGFSANRLELDAVAHHQAWYAIAFRLGGHLKFSGRILLKPDGDLSWRSRIRFRQGAFSDGSYLYGGEHLKGILTLNGWWRHRDGTGSVSAEFRIDRGEVLLDRFYFDLKQTPLTVALEGTWQPGRKHLKIRRLRCVLADVFTGNLSGGIDYDPTATALRLRLRVPPQGVSNLLNTLVKDPFSDQLPALQSARWRGTWAGSLEILGDLHNPWFRGRLQVENAELNLPAKGIRVAGLSGLVPIWVGPGTPAEPSTGPAVAGHLEVERFSTRLGSIQHLSFLFSVRPNQLNLTRPVEFPSAGKPLTVRGLELHFPNLESFSGKALVDSDGFMLDSILANLFGVSVPATVTTRGGTIHLEGNRLRADGEFVTRIFSGQLVVRNLRATDLFSLNRTLYLDADWRDLDLEQLTRTTHFGRITGLLEGSLTGLAVSVWGPLAFDLVLRSQDQAGIRRRISVTAIDNLAQVGSGQSPFVGASALLKLFKDFRYKKIGIRCTLRNNRFSIRGLMAKKGVEYLVKRQGFTGVDIVNRNPDNRISWNDMIERLQRIGHSGQPSKQ